jgi:CrcB protein
MQLVFAIAAGGALGAVARHYTTLLMGKALGLGGFPFGTMTANIVGSFLIGLLVTALSFKFEASQELRGFLVVGFLGGFTTFSSYSLETVLLFERGNWIAGASYSLGSLLIGVIALLFGMWLGKGLA